MVIVTGAGRAFCSGHDLKEMRALQSEEEVAALFHSCSAMMQKLTAQPQPVIAAVNGIATAAGCQLVAQCDLAVASDEARFAASGVNLGLFCSTPAVPLSRNISRKRAAEMLFTGEFIEAETALDWGLVNRVAPPERLLETAHELANNLKSKPREVLALGKSLFYRQLEHGLAAAYADASSYHRAQHGGRTSRARAWMPSSRSARPTGRPDSRPAHQESEARAQAWAARIPRRRAAPRAGCPPRWCGSSPRPGASRSCADRSSRVPCSSRRPRC